MPEKWVQKKPKEIPTILWAGRMIPWKRVDLLLKAVAWARENGCRDFILRIIGFGSEEENLKELAAKLGVQNICKFDGPMIASEIGFAMEDADIYVLPSNKNEGWGVVINEAMSRGCCVIGAIEVGAVPWLIEDGVNGYIFEGESPENLGFLLKMTIDNAKKRNEIGNLAQKTIMDFWSPTVAADRLVNLCKVLLEDKSSPYHDDGPCSPA
jgi:glycosyltransferase involved in cell wall biosynthesis